ncbi:L,D-transpeptidase family protein [Moraxella oblonga]|uniref:L,D-transpeptidase family protein n=1 Tax=Moraxella oblonga TaxID=200413 RepID=UPI000ACFD5D3|nr:L,D-transpeptidase family protein [Moraxella oblonga]
MKTFTKTTLSLIVALNIGLMAHQAVANPLESVETTEHTKKQRFKKLKEALAKDTSTTTDHTIATAGVLDTTVSFGDGESEVSFETNDTVEDVNTTTTPEEADISSGDVEIPTTPTKVDDTAINSIEKDGKRHTTVNLSEYAKAVNESVWSPNMKVNSAMTVKLQVLLDWNHASPGPIDGGWGMNSKKALTNFQKIKGLPATGKMDEATWKALTANIPASQPALVSYTITQEDVNNRFARLPASAEERSKVKGLYYENIVEMFGERFHMDVGYLKKLNPNKKFVAGETITVINTGKPFSGKITRVIADRSEKILYAYNGDKLVAAYPTTVGGAASNTPGGTYKIVNKVKMPHYKATVDKDSENPKSYILPPGPNSPVGVVWMGLNKPSYGIHGSPMPEGISRQSSLGCVRLTNWDVLELSSVIDVGATVEIK